MLNSLQTCARIEAVILLIFAFQKMLHCKNINGNNSLNWSLTPCQVKVEVIQCILCQYHGCCWPGDISHQAISRQDTYLSQHTPADCFTLEPTTPSLLFSQIYNNPPWKESKWQNQISVKMSTDLMSENTRWSNKIQSTQGKKIRSVTHIEVSLEMDSLTWNDSCRLILFSACRLN